MEIAEGRRYWTEELKKRLDRHATMIYEAEEDMSARGCVVPAFAGELSWKKFEGRKDRWCIMLYERPLSDAPISDRTRFGKAAIEQLVEAADKAMANILERSFA